MTQPTKRRKKKRKCITGKACLTKEEAEDRLWYIKFYGLAWRKEQATYLCRFCGSWHLTSKEQRDGMDSSE